jgi:predicted dehydrogenase
MKRLPRLGFLGVGWIGRNRLQAVLASGSAEIVALVDQCEAACAATLDLAREARPCRSLDEMLELELDGVVIATPSAQHAEQSIQVLESGRAVFCQKPLARTLAETERVLQAARRADRLLAVDFSYRYTRALRCIRELVNAGKLGSIYAANLVFHNAYGPDKAWFYDKQASGGGCVIDLGIHLIDAALWMLGFPEVGGVSSRLYAGGRPAEPESVEDYAVAGIDLANGTHIQIACSWNLSAGCEAVIGAEFYGTQAAAAVRNVNGSFYDFEAHLMQKTSRRTLASPPDAWGGRAIVDFAKTLARDPSYDPSADHLLRVAEVVDAVYGRPGTTDRALDRQRSVEAPQPATLHAGAL